MLLKLPCVQERRSLVQMHIPAPLADPLIVTSARGVPNLREAL